MPRFNCGEGGDPYDPAVTEEAEKPLPSSDKLKTNVANFMRRADKIVDHPLAGKNPTFTIQVTFDPETNAITKADLDLDNLDESGWVYLAVLMRPIMFLEQDPIAFRKVANDLSFEHRELAPMLKVAKAEFESWKSEMMFGVQHLGKAKDPLPEGETALVSLATGPVGTLPEGVSKSDFTPDYELADIYLNACVWHSDNDKAQKFFDASAMIQANYAKCAEIRTLSAIRLITQLRQFILDAREHDGFDF